MHIPAHPIAIIYANVKYPKVLIYLRIFDIRTYPNKDPKIRIFVKALSQDPTQAHFDWVGQSWDK